MKTAITFPDSMCVIAPLINVWTVLMTGIAQIGRSARRASVWRNHALILAVSAPSALQVALGIQHVQEGRFVAMNMPVAALSISA